MVTCFSLSSFLVIKFSFHRTDIFTFSQVALLLSRKIENNSFISVLFESTSFSKMQISLVGNSLTLKDPFISESYIEIKLSSIFIFTLLCGASKGFMKAFQDEKFGRSVKKLWLGRLFYRIAVYVLMFLSDIYLFHYLESIK